MQMISMAIDRLADQLQFLNTSIIIISFLFLSLNVYKLKKKK